MSEVHSWKLRNEFTQVYFGTLRSHIQYKKAEKKPFYYFILAGSSFIQLNTWREGVLKYTMYDPDFEDFSTKSDGRPASDCLTADQLYDILRGHFSINMTQKALHTYLARLLGTEDWKPSVSKLEGVEPCLPIQRT